MSKARWNTMRWCHGNRTSSLHCVFCYTLQNTLHCQGDLQFKENTVIDRAGNQVVKGLVTFFGGVTCTGSQYKRWIAGGLGGALWQRCSYCNCFRPQPFGAAAMFFFAFWQLLSVFACMNLPLWVFWAFCGWDCPPKDCVFDRASGELVETICWSCWQVAERYSCIWMNKV